MSLFFKSYVELAVLSSLGVVGAVFTVLATATAAIAMISTQSASQHTDVFPPNPETIRRSNHSFGLAFLPPSADGTQANWQDYSLWNLGRACEVLCLMGGLPALVPAIMGDMKRPLKEFEGCSFRAHAWMLLFYGGVAVFGYVAFGRGLHL